jgi:hypothetical protein
MEAWFPKWDALIISGFRKAEIWNEIEKLRVELNTHTRLKFNLFSPFPEND